MSNLVHSSATGSLQITSIDDMSRISKMLAESGFFSDAKSAAQCGAKVLAGLEMGIGAFASMTGIHIIKGKPVVGAGIMASRIKSSGKYDYEVLENSTSNCEIAIYEVEFKDSFRALKKEVAKGNLSPGEYKERVKLICLGVSSFSIQDAKSAGCLSNDVWTKFPRNMLFARAMSNAVKWYCPDVFSTSVYTPEEMGEIVDEDGDLVPTQTYSQLQPSSSTAPRPIQQAQSPKSFESSAVQAIEVARDELSEEEVKKKERLTTIEKLIATSDEALNYKWVRAKTKELFPDLIPDEKGSVASQLSVEMLDAIIVSMKKFLEDLNEEIPV